MRTAEDLCTLVLLLWCTRCIRPSYSSTKKSAANAQSVEVMRTLAGNRVYTPSVDRKYSAVRARPSALYAFSDRMADAAHSDRITRETKCRFLVNNTLIHARP